MKRTLSVIAFAAAVTFLCVQAWSAGSKLVLKGTGARTMGFTVYYASLYVPEDMKGADAKAIIEADKQMQVNLVIDTRLLSRDKFVKAIREGFGKARGSGYGTDKVEQFLGYFKSVEMKKGDTVYLSYNRGSLSASYKVAGGQAKAMGSIAGVQFKKALFAIWLGPNPAQEGLKKGMLGK